TLRRPVFTAENITVDNAGIGDYMFTTLTASLHYEPGADGGTWHVEDFLARNEDLTLTGEASLSANHRFAVSAAASSVNLGIVTPYLRDYTTIAGRGEATASVQGVLRDNKAEEVTGRVTARTDGLTVNGIAFGDLQGTAAGQPAVFTVRG